MFGFSFTCGGEYMDYLLTDHAWMPKRLANLCIEDLVYLPDSMMIGNRMPVSDQTFTRADMGLPDDGFVLCNFNQTFKIEPSIFSVWMNMLRRIPDSVLWLGGWDETAVQNLRREAEARGVAGQRLIFADVLSHPEHLSRLSLADLAVDNRYHGGGATSIDALWAGVPLLTCQGETPASGNGKSLALAIGVGEMVVDSMAEYEETGVALARDSQRYQALRRKVENNRHGSALFNPALYARHLEMAIELMWERTVAGMSGDIEVPRYAGGALSD
jgi:predicted O-linked N-acetylglucosamine transferase (SPINDLY family)